MTLALIDRAFAALHKDVQVPTYLPTYLHTNPVSYLSAYLPTYLPTHPLSYLPTYLPTDLHTNQVFYLPTYLPTHLLTDLPTHSPAYQPTHFPTCLPIYLPTYLPTYVLVSIMLNRTPLSDGGVDGEAKDVTQSRVLVGPPQVFLRRLMPRVNHSESLTRGHLTGAIEYQFATVPPFQMEVLMALTSRLIFLADVKWSCLRLNEPALPPFQMEVLMAKRKTIAGGEEKRTKSSDPGPLLRQVPLHLSIYLSIYLYPSVFLSIYLSFYSSIDLSIYQNLSIYISI